MKEKVSLHHLRKQYNLDQLLINQVESSPVLQFKKWYEEAQNFGGFEANAMVLSTVNSSGDVSSRVVLLKEFSQAGFVFFSNYESHKGLAIEANNNVALLFFYESMQRQIRIKGVAHKLSAQENDDYFYSRPIDSQYGAMISQQSSEVTNREELDNAFELIKRQHPKPKRPENWGGYLIKATQFEFWQGRPNRLHDRIIYDKQDQENWLIKRLAP